MNVIIKDIIESNLATDSDQGHLVFTEVERLMGESVQTEKIHIDFEGIELITTAFLNKAVGEIFRKYSFETLQQRVLFRNITDDSDLEMLRLVIMNAVEVFEDQDHE